MTGEDRSLTEDLTGRLLAHAEQRAIYRQGAKLRRKMVPALPAQAIAEPDERYAVRSEAYALAKAHRNKPWARRYLRSVGRLRGY